MKIRKASTRGILDAGWITSCRTFSNNSYCDARYMCWHNLRVINDDILQPGHMVPNHEHKNFDILGYLVSGELEHCDSLGNCVRATSGQIQHMWCGSSIWHSEANLGAEPARYLQIWITPDDQYCDTAPYYEIINKPIEFGPIIIDLKHNMQIHAGVLAGTHTIDIGDTSYLYVVSGVITGNDFELHSGDGAELDAALTAAFDAHVILFTVAKNI